MQISGILLVFKSQITLTRQKYWHPTLSIRNVVDSEFNRFANFVLVLFLVEFDAVGLGPGALVPIPCTIMV